MNDRITNLARKLPFAFSERNLLCAALTHPSFSAEHDPPPPNNQRLEFLGDAVLQLLATDLIFEQLPDLPEGKMTKIRSVLTQEAALVRYARRLELGDALRLGRGEDMSGGRTRASNLGDAFEAVLGAAYIDGGFEAARAICAPLIAEDLADHEALLIQENPKGSLQEALQAEYGETPVYEVVRVSGPEHAPLFRIRVVLKGEELAFAKGGNRKEAEKEAARIALGKLSSRSGQEGAAGTEKGVSDRNPDT